MNRLVQPRARILNCLPSANLENDWSPASARTAGVLAAALPVPAGKDLREGWWKVGDQKTTGSCVGWAIADGVLRWHFVKLGRIAKNECLSVRFAWMAAKETDEFDSRPTTFIEMDGTSLKAALDVARKYGAVRESVLPFAATSLCCDFDTNSFFALASQLKINGYFNLGKDFHVWREWLAFKGPILARLEVDDSWQEAARSRGRLETYLAQTTHGGHAVTLVGYTPDCFIVRNSWSTDWGDCGFAYASLSYVEAAFTEAYGVSVI
jgi:hypothetical protein